MDFDHIGQVWPQLLSPWALFIFGLCIGSFLNVVIHRIPKMLEQQWLSEARAALNVAEPDGGKAPSTFNLAHPASHCPACEHKIRWFENLPLLSWLVLRGKCSACGAPISWRYPLIELSTGLLFAACSWRFGSQPTTLLWCGFMAA